MVADLVLRTLRHVVRTLNNEQLTWAVVGGVALSVWDHVRNTQDTDFLVGVGDNPDDMLNAIQAAGLRPKHDPPILSVGNHRFAQFLYEPPESYMDIQVDFLLADTDFQRDALARRVATHFPDVESDVFVLACEDLIASKLLAGRIIDLADAAALLRANLDCLDFSLLRRECVRIGVADELTRVWDEAFPNTAMPGADGC